VPSADASFVCDYRYLSPFNPTVYANHNLRDRIAGTPLAARMEAIGHRVMGHVRQEVGAAQVGFVLDAIVDDRDQPWLLEVNSNPQGHPDVYPLMLDGLFGPRQAPVRIGLVPELVR
jgi:hypothetical protein